MLLVQNGFPEISAAQRQTVASFPDSRPPGTNRCVFSLTRAEDPLVSFHPTTVEEGDVEEPQELDFCHEATSPLALPLALGEGGDSRIRASRARRFGDMRVLETYGRTG
jgi:hypothetical protein